MSAPALALSRYGKTAALAASSAMGESKLFLLDYLLRVGRVVVLLAIWRAVLPRHGAVAGVTLAAVLTYTVVSEAFAEQMTCTTNIATELWEGSIATRMLQPLTLVEHYGADMVGRWLVGLGLFTLPLLLCAPLLGVNPLPASPQAGALFVLSLALAVVIGLAVEFFFLGVTFALGQAVWVVARMRTAISTILSGALLPLALLPWGLGGIFAWLPFASMASAPLQIYTGTGHVVFLLLAQAGWAVALWPLTLWLWRANREKLVGYGG